jgi:hypothetical protein
MAVPAFAGALAAAGLHWQLWPLARRDSVS